MRYVSCKGRWPLSIVMVAVLALSILSGRAALAQPAGFMTRNFRTTDQAVNGAAYGSDGTLYYTMGAGATLFTEALDGTTGSITLNPATGDPFTTFTNVGGIAIDPTTNDLFVTDNKGFQDGLGDLYRVSISGGTGTVSTVLSDIDTIDDVAVRSTGELFISDAAGVNDNGTPDNFDDDFLAGAVYQVDPTDGLILATVKDGLEFAAGLAFDPNGDLIFGQAFKAPGFFNFDGEVWRVGIDDSGASLVFDPPQKLLGDIAPSTNDVMVDAEGDIFITASDGLYQLIESAGTYTGVEDFKTQADWFGGEIAYLPQAGGFEPGPVAHGDLMSFVNTAWPSPNTFQTIQPVPAPTAVTVFAIGLMALRRRVGKLH